MLKSLFSANIVVLCCLSLALVTIAGCAATVSPAVSGMGKMAAGQMDTLTGTEILAVSTEFLPDLHLTAAQADAIAQFMAENNIKTIEDLQALLQQAIDNPDSIKLPAGMTELFSGFDWSGLLGGSLTP